MTSASSIKPPAPWFRDAGVILPVVALCVGIVFQVLDAGGMHSPLAVEAVQGVALLGLVFWTVFVALRHAEAIAHRVGEPYGTLVLTFAVTIIEVSVIVAVMLHGEPNPTLARESVFSTVMIVCGGVIGLCLTLGGWLHGHQELKRQGTSALLAVVMALSALTLIMPNFTLTGTGTYSTLQLAFVSLLGLLLYGTFILAQMTRHRDDFVEERTGAEVEEPPPPSRGLVASFALLMAGLIGIVLLAEHLAAGLETNLETLHIRQLDAIIGAFIATLVLMPEMVSAVRAALGNDLQRSINIALGSACATIGLTIPVVAAVSLLTGSELTLGLKAGDMVLLVLALAISIVSFGTGRTTVLTGAVHLVVFVAFLLLIAVP